MRQRRAVLVTGGGRGIGRAASLLLAARGHAICVNYRHSRNHADAVLREIEAMGGDAIAVRADIADEDQVVRMFEQCTVAFGTIEALVNNAGVLAPLSPLAEIDGVRLRRVLSVNVLGALLCAREAVRRMSTSRGGLGGAIVNVSSVAARTGSPFAYVDYASSKGAIDSLTVGLAREVAHEGIRVNAVRPGFIETGIHDDSGDSQRLAKVACEIPMRRAGSPAEVAHAIAWLLSPEASYVTGAIVDVSGGR